MAFQHYGRRTRTFVQVVAQLAILAYAFQVLAFDHWQAGSSASPADAATHSTHCHGLTSGCADSAGAVTAVMEVTLAPLPPHAVLFDGAETQTAFTEAFLPSLTQPPRGI